MADTSKVNGVLYPCTCGCGAMRVLPPHWVLEVFQPLPKAEAALLREYL